MRSAKAKLRAWTAGFLQGRRRGRRCPVATLSAGVLTWSWPWADPAGWDIYQSHDGGGTFVLEEEGWPGDRREYVPADGMLPAYLVGVKASGNPVTGRSAVAISRPAAPVILGATAHWNASVVGWADVTLTLSFDHGPWPEATLEVFFILDAWGEALAGTVASTATAFAHGNVTQAESYVMYRARYRNGGVIGPTCAWFPLEISIP